ncbi:MAG: hypothetical protein P0Y53_20855 [Candidatus Pseudobacter hemicellulosilyticus]|uniref:Uncharacterized protein n=1 Tax=Candidatus Pseudobacter hemicellulosilyticus TaxID=3121375 RepID=A0AAJ5WN06_9BACT|nr:MAG: hypothetical protein P0Y53_20855 [Pseudobacter sp.]
MISQDKLRRLFRKSVNRFLSVQRAARILQLNKAAAVELMACLEDQGYIEEAGLDGLWQLSIRGKLIVQTNFKKAFTEETLKQSVENLLERASMVNASSEYPYYISCIKIINDYPIGNKGEPVYALFSLDRKQLSNEAFRAAEDNLRKRYTGNFRRIIDYAYYPRKTIGIFLKSGSHALQLTEDYETGKKEGHTIFTA